MTVIPLQEPWTRPRSYTSREKFIDAVRDEVFASPLTYEEIAAKAGCVKGTISNLASGKTAWPRHTTLFGVVAALNLQIRLEKRRGK